MKNLPPVEAKSVCIGYGEIILFGEDEIEEGQLGYSVDTNKQSLVGEADGNWLKDWTVIGYETTCGDPIFIDSSKKDFPVFTAMHGQGSWDPDLISRTYARFLKILEKLKILSVGRENPVKMEDNPITQREYDVFVAFAIEAGELEDAWYWENIAQDEDAGVGPS